MTKNIFLFILPVLFTVCPSILLSRPKLTLAQSFSSPNYLLNMGNFNTTSGSKTSTNYRLTDTVGQLTPGQFTSTGYIVKSGFQYIYDTFYAFSFSINYQSIDFGTLTPNIGTTQTNVLTISSPAGHGYQIMTSENHPLWIDAVSQIADTTCDAADCSETTSGVWTSNSTYGFGFNASGIGATAYFANSTYYRQFADTSANESPQILASENSPARNRQTTITYKVNINSLQAAGNYQNAITFIAIPKY